MNFETFFEQKKLQFFDLIVIRPKNYFRLMIKTLRTARKYNIKITKILQKFNKNGSYKSN